MMYIKTKKLLAVCFFLWIFIPSYVHAQLILGQYEDEAPLRTWNILGVSTASHIGMGNTGFASAFDCSSALINPSLLTKLPKYTVVMNTSYNMGQMNKYSFINTGVLITEKNAGLGVLSLNFFGISMNQKGWGLAASTSILEDYDRPKIESEYFIGETLYQTIFFKQEGLLRNFNLALSRKVNSWISAGIGINFVMGSFRKEWSEKWIFSEITISDEKIHDFSGFYLNGGMVFNLTHKLSLGVIFRTPFTKNATSESLLENNSPGGDTFIQIQVKDKSHYKQPLVLGAGLNYQLFNNFRIALDMSYFNWASYTVNYFGESLDRNFKNIIKLNTGIEYQGFIRIFGHKMTVPMRVGFVYDPQPMRNPNSKYSYFSLGSGIRGKNIHLDVASMIGFETGSGDKLRGLKWTMTLGFHL